MVCGGWNTSHGGRAAAEVKGWCCVVLDKIHPPSARGPGVPQLPASIPTAPHPGWVAVLRRGGGLSTGHGPVPGGRWGGRPRHGLARRWPISLPGWSQTIFLLLGALSALWLQRGTLVEPTPRAGGNCLGGREAELFTSCTCASLAWALLRIETEASLYASHSCGS